MKVTKWQFLLCAIWLMLIVVSAQALVLVSGFDPRCISIDGNVTSAGDSCPFVWCTTCTDWLAKQTDKSIVVISDGYGNADQSIFSPGPTYNTGSTLPKQDIVNTRISNNHYDMYLQEERRSNNGDSGWHIFATKISPDASPTVVANPVPITLGKPVYYHISNNDLEIRICFPKGSDPGGASIHVFKASGLAAPVNLLATDIWASGVFKLVSDTAIDGFALNLAPTQALSGARDAQGNLTSTYDTACFAEAAINLLAVGIDPCNGTAYISVITRSSCSLTSDLKDFAGPFLYSFGGPTLGNPTVSVDCNNLAKFSATVDDGQAPYRFQWYLDGATTPDRDVSLPGPPPVTDSWTKTLTAGSHSVKVKVTDANGCTEEATAGPFTVYGLLKVTISGTPNCPGSIPMTATVTGGSGGITYQWKLDGVVVGTNSPNYTYGPKVDCVEHTLCVTVTDSRGCTASVCRKIKQTAATSMP